MICRDDDKILNPKTNKCVKKTGRIGMQILGPYCDQDKIRNPKSNRCVLKTGNIGRAILGISRKHVAKDYVRSRKKDSLKQVKDSVKSLKDKELTKDERKSVKLTKNINNSVKSLKDKKLSKDLTKDKKDSKELMKDERKSVKLAKDINNSVKDLKDKKVSKDLKKKNKFVKQHKDNVKSLKDKKESVKFNKIEIRKNECFTVGLNQITSTCWFNSIINGFILGDKTYKILLSKYNELSNKEREQVTIMQDIISCPLHLKKLHFFQIFHQFLLNNQGNLNTNIKQGFNIPRKVIDNLGLRSTPNWHDKQPAYFIHLALPKIMQAIFDKDEYEIIKTNSLKIDQNLTLSKKIVILQANLGNYVSIDSLQIPKTYVVGHVGISLRAKVIGHAITGFVCKNKYYIYDSGTSNIIEANWRDPKVILDYFPKKSFTEATFTYICLVRD